jgi:hypothetical protein
LRIGRERTPRLNGSQVAIGPATQAMTIFTALNSSHSA